MKTPGGGCARSLEGNIRLTEWREYVPNEVEKQFAAGSLLDMQGRAS